MFYPSILPDKFASFDYYRKRLPHYLQMDEKFLTHFRIWYDLLVGERSYDVTILGAIPSADAILFALNIFDPNYISWLYSLEAPVPMADLLDQIGEIYDLHRTMIVVDDGDAEEITLNDEEFLQLIKTQIIRNNFEGTNEQIAEFYKECGLQMIYLNQLPGNCDIRFVISPSASNKNMRLLFLNGWITIESVGIAYTRAIYNTANLLLWDGQAAANKWGTGIWE